MLYVLLLFVAGRCLVPMDETDLFFNLRLGELVLARHQVPTDNLLSFTFPEARDVNLAWIFQIVLALAHRAAGIPGTVVLKTGFVLCTWATLYRVAIRRGAEPALAALALALAAWAAEPRFVERPHLVTFLGIGLLLAAIERAEAGRPRALWLVVPGGLVWANANSCFFLAPTILFLYASGARLDGLLPESRRAFRVGLALLPLIVATPSGWLAFSYIANHIRMPWLRPLQEYRMAEWPVDGPFFLLAGLLAGVLLYGASMRPRGPCLLVPFRVLAPLVAVGALGALRIRFVAEFAILAGPALAVAASRLAPAAPAGRWTAKSKTAATVAVAAAVIALTVVPRAEAAASGAPWFDIGLEAGLVPAHAIAFADEAGLRRRMYNDLEVGSYLSWQGWPRFPVFQDPRINGYPESFHAVMRRADLSRDEWQGWLDGFSVDAALLTYPGVNPRAAWFAPEKWALVYQAADGLVFTRRLSERANLIAEREIPLTFTFEPATGLRPVPIEREPLASVVPACEWQRRLGDHHRTARDDRAALRAYASALEAASGACLASAWQSSVRQAGGALALRLGEAAHAAVLLDGLTAPAARANLGFARLGMGQATAALIDFDAVLAGWRDNDEARFGRGLALEALGRPGQAAETYAAFLAHAPTHLAAPSARARLEHLRAATHSHPMR